MRPSLGSLPSRSGGKVGGSLPQDWTFGDAVETAGLVLGNSIFAIVLVVTQYHQGPNWNLWGIALLVVVWASLRPGPAAAAP